MVYTHGMYSFCSNGLPTRAFLRLFGNKVLVFLYSDALKPKRTADKHCFGHLTLLFDLARQCKMNKLGIYYKRVSVLASQNIRFINWGFVLFSPSSPQLFKIKKVPCHFFMLANGCFLLCLNCDFSAAYLFMKRTLISHITNIFTYSPSRYVF